MSDRPRNTVYPQVYLHCLTSLRSLQRACAASPTFDRYPERALVLAGSADAVCVPYEVDPDYLDFLAELRLGPAPENVIVVGAGEGGLAARLISNPSALARIAELGSVSGGITVHPYAATADAFTLAAALERTTGVTVRVAGGSARLTEYADQKHHIRAKAMELGVPVAEGEVVELAVRGSRMRLDLEPLRTAIGRQLGRTGRVIVRGASGTSGSANFVVGGGADVSAALRRIALRSDNSVYLVEGMVEATVSPNVQMHIDPSDGAITCAGATDQRWGRSLVHAGNALPSAARTLEAMEGWARRLTEWMRGEGHVGLLGFDFVEYREPLTGAPRAILAELNPRVNGATYPLAIRDRLKAAAFTSGTLTTRARRFGALREALGDLLFDVESGSGVIPYATGCLDQGSCFAVALGSTREQADELYGEAQAALEASCVTR